MIDFQKLLKEQQLGDKQLAELTEQEKTVLSHYCWLSADGLLKLGAQKKASVNDIVMNAFRNGIALGLRVSIVNKEVKER